MKLREFLEVINLNSRVVLIDGLVNQEIEETTASDEITLENYEECEVLYVDVYALDYEGYPTYHIEINDDTHPLVSDEIRCYEEYLND